MNLNITKKRTLGVVTVLLLSAVGTLFQNCAEVASPETEFMITEDSAEPVLCDVPNGQGERAWVDGVLGPCEVSFCKLNYKIEGNTCVFSVSSCPINNGVGITETSGLCRATSCKTNYSLYDNSCVVNRKSCPFPNGTGEKVWDGDSYGVCLPKTCNANFTLYDQECQPILTNNNFFPRTKEFNIVRSDDLNLTFTTQNGIPFNTDVHLKVTQINTAERLRAINYIRGLAIGKTFSFSALRTLKNFSLNIPTSNTKLTKPLSIEFDVISSQNLFPTKVTLNITPNPKDYVDVSYQVTPSDFKYCLALNHEGELRFGSTNCDSGFSNDGSNIRMNTATGSVVKAFESVTGSPTFFYHEVKATGQEQLVSRNQSVTTIFQSNFPIRRFMAGTSHAVLLLGDRTKFAVTNKLSSGRLVYFDPQIGSMLDIAMTNRNTENLFALGIDGNVYWLKYLAGKYVKHKTLNYPNKVIAIAGGLDHISMLTEAQNIQMINVNTESKRYFSLPEHNYGIHKIVGSGSHLQIWYRDNAIRYYTIGTSLEAAETNLGLIKSTHLQTYSGRRYYSPISNTFSILNFP